MKVRNIIAALAALVVALAFQACNQTAPADAGSLLATVPADVSFVAVVNSASILEKSDCKIEDAKVIPGKDAMASFDKIKSADIKSTLTDLLNGDSGIDPSVMVVFKEGYTTYVTGVAAEPEKFKQSIEQKHNVKFSVKDGIETALNTAVAGNQFWVSLSGQTSIDINDVRHFSSLAENQSFMQNAYASNLAEVTQDVEMWCNISGLMNTSGLDFQQRAMAQMALQTLFDDPSALALSFSLAKGEFKIEMKVLNSKAKPAKFLLPSDKLDIASIAGIGGTTNMLAAVSVPGKLIEKLKKDTDKQRTSVLGIYLNELGCLDGTIAYAQSGENLKGVITTDGKGVATLASFLNSMDVKTQMNGNVLNISKGQVTGKGSVEQMANDFKGAIAGMDAADLHEAGFPANGLASGSLMLYPESGSVTVKVRVLAADKNENPIVLIANL